MTAKQPLNERQLKVLRWIADGRPDDVWSEGDFSYKTTCYALASRGLADVDRRPRTWSATLTDDGLYYLNHGRYPGSSIEALLERAVEARTRKVDRPSAAEYAAAIMERLEEAGGPIEISQQHIDLNIRQIEDAAVRSPWRPSGKKLRLDGAGPWSDRRLRAHFDEDVEVRIERREVPVPMRVTKWHPAVQAYREDADRHEVTKGSLGRACRVMQAIATEAERRGHELTHVKHSGRYYAEFRRAIATGQFALRVGDQSYALRIVEIAGGGGGKRDYRDRSRLPRWQDAKTTTFVPTGRLSISITTWARNGRPDRFKDGKRTKLEDQLAELFRELEIRAVEDDRQAEHRKLEAEEERRQWARAMEAARVKMVEADRVERLHDRAKEWERFNRVRAYVDELRKRVADEPEVSPDIAAWLNWSDEHLREADPLRALPSMPEPPEPTAENMKPFLGHYGFQRPGSRR